MKPYIVVREAIEKYPDALNDQQKLKALLRDCLPGEKLIVNNFLAANEEGLVTLIMQGGAVDEFAWQRYTSLLTSNHGLSEEAAHRTIIFVSAVCDKATTAPALKRGEAGKSQVGNSAERPEGEKRCERKQPPPDSESQFGSSKTGATTGKATSNLTSCPVCSRKDVARSGRCPGCGIPVKEYLKATPSFKDPSEGDKVRCSVCGFSFDRASSYSCPKCGEGLPSSEWISAVSERCPRCGSGRTEEYDSDFRQRGFLATLFSSGGSIYFINKYWCKNCGHVFKRQLG